MLVGEQLTVSPVVGEILVVRFTVPAKPYLPVIVTVKFALEAAALNLRLAELSVNGEAEPLT
jgi:hypothetical protein